MWTSSSSYVSNADICDESMAGITDWTDADYGTGVSSQPTFDGKSCMKLFTGSFPSSFARRTRDVGTFGARTVFSLNVYCSSIWTSAVDNSFELECCDGTTTLDIIFATDGLFIYDGSAFVEAGTNLVVTGQWQEWTFDVNWTAQTVDVYLEKVLQVSGMDCSYAYGLANGTVRLTQNGATLTNRLSYVDWFKAGSDFA